MRLLKLSLATLLLLPGAWLAYAMAQELAQPGSVLGADPGEAVVLHLGEWGLRILLLTLCVSTLRRLLGKPQLGQLRRLMGLFAFFYLALHVIAYIGLLAGFDWQMVGADFIERPYSIVGLLGFVALLPLAVTSTRGWRRRLGANWQRLHRLVYPAVAFGLVHLWWLTKDGFGELLIYGLVFAALLAERMRAHLRSSSPAHVPAAN